MRYSTRFSIRRSSRGEKKATGCAVAGVCWSWLTPRLRSGGRRIGAFARNSASFRGARHLFPAKRRGKGVLRCRTALRRCCRACKRGVWLWWWSFHSPQSPSVLSDWRLGLPSFARALGRVLLPSRRGHCSRLRPVHTGPLSVCALLFLAARLIRGHVPDLRPLPDPTVTLACAGVAANL